MLYRPDARRCFRSLKQNVSNESQLAKISSILSSSDIPKFKRKSNEEQFKHNAKVICKLDEATENIDALHVEKGKEKVTEAKDMLNHRQKIIQLADSSELGWRLVKEYEAHPSEWWRKEDLQGGSQGDP